MVKYHVGYKTELYGTTAYGTCGAYNGLAEAKEQAMALSIDHPDYEVRLTSRDTEGLHGTGAVLHWFYAGEMTDRRQERTAISQQGGRMKATATWSHSLASGQDFREIADLIFESECAVQSRYLYIPNPVARFDWQISGAFVSGEVRLQGDEDPVRDMMEMYPLQGWKIEEDA